MKSTTGYRVTPNKLSTNLHLIRIYTAQRRPEQYTSQNTKKMEKFAYCKLAWWKVSLILCYISKTCYIPLSKQNLFDSLCRLRDIILQCSCYYLRTIPSTKVIHVWVNNITKFVVRCSLGIVKTNVEDQHSYI